MAMMLIDTCVVINTIEVIVESVFVIDVGGGGLCRSSKFAWGYNESVVNAFIGRDVVIVVVITVVVVGSGRNVVVVVIEGGSG